MSTRAFDDAILIRRLGIVLAVVGVGLFLGRNISTSPAVALGLFGLFALVFLIVARPGNFILLLMFFLFEAFDLVDVERFARLPGLFRAKDVLIALLLGLTIANATMHRIPQGFFRETSLGKPILFFLVFLVFQGLRTHFWIGESWVLLFRQGRHFLTYALPFFLLLYFREQDWRNMDRWCLFFVILITILSAVDALIVRLPFFHSVADWTAARFGVIKSYNPALLLTYWMFYRRFWLFCIRPSKGNLVVLLIITAALVFYLFRGTIAASVLAIVAVSLIVPAAVRTRAVLVLTIAGVLMFTLSIFVVSLTAAMPKNRVSDALKQYLISTGTDVIRVEGTYASRVNIDRERYPLVRQHPLLGIGFISVFGEIAYRMWMQGGVLPVGTVDTGWLDLMLRLGLIGSVLLLYIFVTEIRIIRKLLQKYSHWTATQRSILLANATLAIAVTLNLIVAGHMSWEPSITVLCISLAWTMRFERETGSSRQIPPLASEELQSDAAPSLIQKNRARGPFLRPAFGA